MGLTWHCSGGAPASARAKMAGTSAGSRTICAAAAGNRSNTIRPRRISISYAHAPERDTIRSMVRLSLLVLLSLSCWALDRKDVEFAHPGAKPLLLDLHVP